jgi:hypothetical protein
MQIQETEVPNILEKVEIKKVRNEGKTKDPY